MQNQEDKGSLEGKGWDILAGGKQHAEEAGGDDPFDIGAVGATPAEENPFAEEGKAGAEDGPFDEPVGVSLTAGGENPFDSDATGDVLDSGHGTAQPSTPAEAYGDWGKGGDRPDVTTAPGEPEPRDLKPEELGYQPGRETEPQPATMVEAQPGDDIYGEAESPAPLVTPASGTTGQALSDGVQVSAATDRPLSEVMEVAQPSRFAAPTTASALEAKFQVYDPFEPVGEPPVYGPPGEDLPLDSDLGPVLVTPDRVDALWNEINQVYEAVIKDVRGNFRSTESLLAELKKARELLLSGLENFDNAEVIVKKVKARLELEVKVRGWSRTVGTWIAFYEVAWLITLLLLVLIQRPVLDVFAGLMPYDMAAAYVPALWGAFGGVLGGLWVLIEHTARKRDFDPIHTRWYVLNPFMGMGLGVVVYALFQMGVIVGGAGTGLAISQQTGAGTGTSWLLYGLCLVVGFQQNVVWDLLDRVLDLIRPDGDDDEEPGMTGPDVDFGGVG